MVARNRKVEQGEATRAQLLRAGRALFAEKGFAETATEEIVQRAAVTRGALYHHFRGKDDLFRAVFEDLEGELAERIATVAARRKDPVQQLRAGFDEFLAACLEPAVQRIVVLEGPSVLGWDAWHEIDAKYFFGLVAAGLEAAMAEGLIRRQPVAPLAHLLLGAAVQAGSVVTRAADPDRERAVLSRAYRQLLEGLRPAG